MKNKKLQYILIPVVLVVWGLIIYRFLDFTRQDTPDETYTVSTLQTNQNNNHEQDTFSLYANYRDPFLKHVRYKGYNYTKANASNKKTEKKKEKKKPETNVELRREILENIRWPDIKYGGIVQNTQSGEKVGLIEVDKQEFLIRKNDSTQKIFIKDLYKDSVIVIYKEKHKTFVTK
ncbi:MAG: hypothetical protein ACOC3T_02285 [Bacteroidota bacterium]